VTYFQERPLTDADRAAVDAHVASRRDKLVTRVSEWLVADERERKETAKFLRDKLTSSDPKIRTPPWDTIDNLDRAWMSRRLQAWLMAWTIEQLGTKQELEDASIIVDREAFLAENKMENAIEEAESGDNLEPLRAIAAEQFGPKFGPRVAALINRPRKRSFARKFSLDDVMCGWRASMSMRSEISGPLPSGEPRMVRSSAATTKNRPRSALRLHYAASTRKIFGAR
jgi:hypothetical protein